MIEYLVRCRIREIDSMIEKAERENRKLKRMATRAGLSTTDAPKDPVQLTFMPLKKCRVDRSKIKQTRQRR